MRHLLLSTVLLMPLPAMAQDLALVLGVERYEQLDRVRRGDDILEANARLEALGFNVLSRANPRDAAARNLASAFQNGASDADRLVVALSGHFVTDGNRTWLLTAESDVPDLFTVQQRGLSLESVVQVMASRPGKAVLLLGTAPLDDLDMRGSVLQAGVGELDIPQGVTVLQTSPTRAASVLGGLLTEPEAEIGQRLFSNTSIVSQGYMPLDWVLMPAEVTAETRDPVTTPQVGVWPSDSQLNAEAALWDRTTAADTVAAYRGYIARYPQGRFVNEAETQISAILAEPNRAARLAEEALSLTRNQRREVQSNLTLLNYNTRGVDGIFGPGSRGAITNWQQSNGFPQTSYLTRDQINLMEAQAARRQAEIAAEEARELARAEARDRAYWSETGAIGDEPGYRAYLDRYPEGLFSNIAEARLATINDSRRTRAEAADRAAWAQAENADSLAVYQNYLAAYPSGVFADEARERIQRLTSPRVSNAQIAQARAEEETLRLSGVRAQLLELRLRDLGYNPGRLDGVIDDTTRTAIAAYQQAEGVTATGYVDRATAVGLMTGNISITIPSR